MEFLGSQGVLKQVETVCNDDALWARDPVLGAIRLEELLLDQPAEQHAGEASGRHSAETLATFWTWLGDAGEAMAEAVDIGWMGPTVGHGLVARRQIEVGKEILRIPSRLMLSAEFGEAAESKVCRLAEQDPLLRASPSLLLALVIAEQRCKGPASFFAPYLDLLPRTYSIPLFWPAACLGHLAAAADVLERAARQWRMAAKQYAYCYRLLGRAELPEFGGGGLSFEAFRWALGTALTRQNQVPSPRGHDVPGSAGQRGGMCLALVPMWDMTNHKEGEYTTSWEDGSGDGAAGAGCLVSTAMECFHAGDQVLMFYGPRSMQDFLLFSGFVPGFSNRHSTSVSLPIPRGDALAPFRRKLLQNQGFRLSSDGWTCETLVCDRAPRRPSLIAACIICSTKGELSSVLRATSSGDSSEPLDIPLDILNRAEDVEAHAVSLRVQELLPSNLPDPSIQGEDTSALTLVLRFLSEQRLILEKFLQPHAHAVAPHPE